MDRKFRVLVVGDIMLDRYTHVDSKRSAPEADIPVWDFEDEEYRLGGAANVANNIKALGSGEVDVFLGGVADPHVLNMIGAAGIYTNFVTLGSGMEKRRYVKDNKILFRVDSCTRFKPEDVDHFSLSLRESLEMNEEGFDMLVFSDYDKGTITGDVVDSFKTHRIKPVIVDSKRRDLRIFKGADILKLNLKEYGIQCGSNHYACVESLFEHVVVTQGPAPTELRMCEHVKSNEKRYMVHTEKFPVDNVHPVDVTGCGDTHTAGMAFSLLKNADVRAAVRFANVVAAKVVKKFGTSVPSKEELQNETR